VSFLSTVIGLAAALHQTALFTGGEWMAAWVFARLTAKWRQPGNFALAIPVQRMFPILENVKFSKILQYRPDIANIVDDAYVAEYAHMGTIFFVFVTLWGSVCNFEEEFL
jgi:hypothetical protein